MPQEQLLNIENLSVEFTAGQDVVKAVSGLNLQVFKAKTTGLVGESGSGKSVTALSILGLLPSTQARVTGGHIWFSHPSEGAKDLLGVSASEMQRIRGRHISMVFQEPMSSLNPVKRCGWQVEEVLKHHLKWRRAAARQKVLSLFEEVRLPEPEKIYRAWPHELSGGQRQRVMIAMAMACEPALLIADEPTTALDVTVQKSILELMRQLQRDHGMGILFISHDLGVISEVADHAAVMREGQIVEAQQKEKLFSQPGHAYTKALIACRPPMQHRPLRLATAADFTKNIHFKPVCEDAASRQAKHQQLYAAPPILEVTGLETSFITRYSFLGVPIQRHTAVNKVGFLVYQGETLGLVGESGCGKTTLGRSLMRLVEPAAGKMIYKGSDLTSLSTRQMRKIRPRFQIIFQDPYASLTPGMMVGKAIIEPMRVHGILDNDRQRKQRAMQLLERVNLEEKHFYRYPHEFSGGQRQRICIARAVALRPEFMICDEAVSALDVSVQAQVLNLLNEMKNDYNLTYLFISHDLSVVKYMSDRIMVMKEGQLVELAEADHLYASPQNEYTRKLLQAIPGATYLQASRQ